MRLLERDIEKTVGAASARMGVGFYKLKLASGAGWPDRTLIYRGRTMFMELKGVGGRLTPLQEFTLERLADKRCVTCVAFSPSEAIEAVRVWVANIDAKDAQ